MSQENSILSELNNLSVEQKKILALKLKQKALDGHNIIAQTLRQNGITHVYSISGTPIDKTLSVCAKNGIRVIGVRHQQAAVMMAAAQNYLQGKLKAVVILSAGPAVTNATTGILVAQDNCFPLIVIGSRRALQSEGMGYFQELNAVPIFQSITKLSQLVDSTAKISASINHGISLAMQGRPGVVYLDIPEDILNAKILDSNNYSLSSPQTYQLDIEAIEKAAFLIKNAQRPVMIIGRGVRWSEPYQELNFLVNSLGIPFTTSPMAQGYLRDDHPLCYNAINSLLFADADLILVVGARLNWTFRFGAEFSTEAKLIHIDIHPPEIGKNMTPTVGIVGDAKEVLQQIIHKLKSTQLNISNSWLNALNHQRQETLKQWELLAQDNSLPISPHRLIKEIREFLSEDAIVAIDGNVILATAQRLLPSYLPASRFTPGTNGCMGVGIPFAIAAKVSFPERPVIVITGDTAFGLNGMEMETAVRLSLPLIVIVANNDGNSGCLKQKEFYPHDYPDKVTMFQANIHYEKIMEAFGGYTEYVETPEQIKPALSRALNSGVAACINVKVNSQTPYPSK